MFFFLLVIWRFRKEEHLETQMQEQRQAAMRMRK
jgi:hypothetical protein